MDQSPDIRVLVGVEGGGGDGGDSGKLIKSELESIIKGISNNNPPQIKLSLDVKGTQDNFQKQLNIIVGKLKINGGISLGGLVSGNGDKANTFQKQIEETTKAVQSQTKLKQELEKILSSYSINGKTNSTIAGFDADFSKLGLQAKKGLIEPLNEVKVAYEKVIIAAEEFKGINVDALNNKEKTELQTKISEFNKLTKVYKDATVGYKELANIQKKNEQKSFVSANELSKMRSFINNLESFEKINNRIHSNAGLSSTYKSILSDATSDLATGNFNATKLKEYEARLSSLRTETRALGLEGQTWITKIGSQIQKLGIYFNATIIMMGAWRQVKNMIQDVVELDAAMTELKKVTSETETTYTNFLDNAEKRAKNLGATLTDTVRATADFARLGYSIKEAETISDAALVYKNVGDGIQNINESSESIISTMKAFGVEASNAMSIVDRFNIVGKLYAHAA